MKEIHLCVISHAENPANPLNKQQLLSLHSKDVWHILLFQMPSVLSLSFFAFTNMMS